jgi:exodeoxyribonuclease III
MTLSLNLDHVLVETSSTMRIVAWNANMGVHRKFAHLTEELAPDIAVIPECATPEILMRKGLLGLEPSRAIWIGRNPNKGLAVFSFNQYEVQLAPCIDRSLEWVAPVEVKGPVGFRLLAVWAMSIATRGNGPDLPRCTEPMAALDVYREWYADHPLVVAGDFNHNVIWDRPRATERNHSRTIRACSDAGLASAYHAWTGDEYGEEVAPTIYWRNRTEDGPRFHIDYAFVPREWVPSISSLEVGSYADWVGSKRSDHVPLVLDVDLG